MSQNKRQRRKNRLKKRKYKNIIKRKKRKNRQSGDFQQINIMRKTKKNYNFSRIL